MAGFVEGVDRGPRTLFPALLDDYVAEDNPVRVVRFLPRNLPRQRAFEIGLGADRRSGHAPCLVC
jgi:hypothetical protein